MQHEFCLFFCVFRITGKIALSPRDRESIPFAPQTQCAKCHLRQSANPEEWRGKEAHNFLPAQSFTRIVENQKRLSLRSKKKAPSPESPTSSPFAFGALASKSFYCDILRQPHSFWYCWHLKKGKIKKDLEKLQERRLSHACKTKVKR